MTGTEFEDFVVGLRWRDGCTHVRRGGRSHSNGADVRGSRSPDAAPTCLWSTSSTWPKR
ncbi:hypothetical protein ACFYZ3_20220 [Streptomyces sp. NPDC001599]|uniref:hypothetical protein n=1 Tax=Streptomyces sp. NPDC001599 TaxID=3364591 RepID=UPI00368E9B52